MDNIAEAIASAEDDLAMTRQELRMAREMVAGLEQDAKGMEIELEGLRRYAQRRGINIDRGAPLAVVEGGDVVPISRELMAEAPVTGLLTMSRSDAVAAVLAQSPGPLDRNAIHEQCALAGRDDSLDDVSLSLTGLKRSQRVEKLGKGLWRLVEETPATGS